jgi:predicted DNA-binding transcriptional regulator AlpA
VREMLTQTEIATRFGLSLSAIQKYSMRLDFPPVVHMGGANGRLNYYDAEAVTSWWQSRNDGRRFNGRKRKSVVEAITRAK